jgi:RNA polymerase sigma-70 factor, ECF subfamily
MDDKTRIFEEHRSTLEGLAYRMLGTRADARDIVQDTYLKWNRANSDEIRSPRSWLITVCSRLAMDAMSSARMRRETYVGPWLPEPFIDEHVPNPADKSQLDDTVSVALMLALEKLSPAERATFILHEVFAYSFEEVSSILGKSVAACRKLGSRAREAVREAKPRFQASAEEHHRLVEAFLDAAHRGELERLKALLAQEVELHSDGGGKAIAAREVLHGAETVGKFFVRVWGNRNRAQSSVRVVTRWFNGVPGVIIYEDGKPVTAVSVAIENGVIHRIYALRNPDKLAPFYERN